MDVDMYSSEIRVGAVEFDIGGGDSGFNTIKGSAAYWKLELGFR